MAPLDSGSQNSCGEVIGASGGIPYLPFKSPDPAPEDASAPPQPPVNSPADGQNSTAAPTDQGQPADQSPDTTFQNFYNKLAQLKWFSKPEEVDIDRLKALHVLADLNSLSGSGDSFELKLRCGRTINWLAQPGEDGKTKQEFIVGKREGFTQADADGIVALSAMHGWKTINVHGTEAEKELLWKAAMKQGLKVKDYEPAHTSDAWKEYQESLNPGVSDASAPPQPSASPADNASSPTPDANANPAAPADTSNPLPSFEEQLRSLDKDTLTRLHKQWAAEETLAKLQNHPDVKEFTLRKNLAYKILKEKRLEEKNAAVPAGDAASPEGTVKPQKTPAESKKSEAKKAQASKTDDSEQPGFWSKDDLLSGEFKKASGRPAKTPEKKTAPAPTGRHRPGKGHHNANSIIAREQKGGAPRHP